jgi:hypothetical protein
MALRGSDSVEKNGPGKAVTRALRRLVLNNAMKDPQAFMPAEYSVIPPALDQGTVDGASHHWLMHLIHAVQVVGYRYPNEGLRKFWHEWYIDACRQMHMNPETEGQMRHRLRGDFGPEL